MFSKLKKLCNKSDAFYSVEQEHAGELYTVFTYRLSSYGDFRDNEYLGSLDCRGITFKNSTGACVSRPMHKFFNLRENPYTESIDYNDVDIIQVKEDGSLISTVCDVGLDWFLKSKTSFKSVQAQMATDYLNTNESYKSAIDDYLYKNYNCTINFEIVSPDNRIVLLYQETTLVILNIRDNITGEYLPIPDSLSPYYVDYLTTSNPEKFIESIYGMADELIEGFVIKLNSGLWFKVKTDKYSTLHRAISKISLPKHILETIITDCSDDIKAVFAETPDLLAPLLEMEAVVIPYYNHMVATVELFNVENKELSQKDYAILAKKEYPEWHGLLMSIRNGKEIKYNKWMLNYYLDLHG